MYLEDIMLSEISMSQKKKKKTQILYDSVYTRYLE